MLPATDPRRVVTLLNTTAVVEVLRSLSLLDDWLAVVDGLRYGFDVGTSAPIPVRLLCKNHTSSTLVCLLNLCCAVSLYVFTVL